MKCSSTKDDLLPKLRKAWQTCKWERTTSVEGTLQSIVAAVALHSILQFLANSANSIKII